MRAAAITEEHRCNANQGRSISEIKDSAGTLQPRSRRVIRPGAFDAVATADRDPTSILGLGGMRDVSQLLAWKCGKGFSPRHLERVE